MKYKNKEIEYIKYGANSLNLNMHKMILRDWKNDHWNYKKMEHSIKDSGTPKLNCDMVEDTKFGLMEVYTRGSG